MMKESSLYKLTRRMDILAKLMTEINEAKEVMDKKVEQANEQAANIVNYLTKKND